MTRDEARRRSTGGLVRLTRSAEVRRQVDGRWLLQEG
jgi:hypothetical protein